MCQNGYKYHNSVFVDRSEHSPIEVIETNTEIKLLYSPLQEQHTNVDIHTIAYMRAYYPRECTSRRCL